MYEKNSNRESLVGRRTGQTILLSCLKLCCNVSLCGRYILHVLCIGTECNKRRSGLSALWNY